jgi:hypothetical protein
MQVTRTWEPCNDVCSQFQPSHVSQQRVGNMLELCTAAAAAPAAAPAAAVVSPTQPTSSVKALNA